MPEARRNSGKYFFKNIFYGLKEVFKKNYRIFLDFSEISKIF